ncbi:MAG: hypothetical protein O2951_04155 [Bacteroidetes bacterium]|nr:hypothetical protein [Bacteroidota bacterium]
MLPNSSGNGKALLTGELNLELLNLFESGKEFNLHWRRMREETQSLDVAIKVPGILNSFDLAAEYFQLKEDTTFVNRVARLKMIFNITPRSSFNWFTEIKSAGLLSEEQEINSMIPENADFSLTTFGVGYSYKTFNKYNLFDDGLSLQFGLSAGKRKINQNPIFSNDIYESLDLVTSFYQLEGNGIYQNTTIRKSNFKKRIK